MEIIDKSEFCSTLFDIYDFGCKAVLENDTEDVLTQFAKKLDELIISRIRDIFNCATHFIFEESYVENEWKEMIAYHYTNTSYSEEIRDRVIRIHFLTGDEFSERYYLGYITLRPIPEMKIALSHVYLNWDNEEFMQKYIRGDVYVMSYLKKIHIEDKELTINTYPLFAQDSIVTCCGDANVIMISKYMANKFGYKRIKISDTKHSFFNKIYLPRTVGSLTVRDMLISNGIPFKLSRHNAKDLIKDEDGYRDTRDTINAYVESKLPVIFGANNHMVQLIGYKGSNAQNGEYIVYDDSGYFYNNLSLNTEDETKRKCFCYTTNFEKIKGCINGNEDKVFFIGICEHERVYIDIKKYLHFLAEFFCYIIDDGKYKHLARLFEKTKENEKQVNRFKSDANVRTFLVDTTILKQHLSKNVIEEFQKSIVTEFVKIKEPHYVWYSEIDAGDGTFYCAMADPTRFHDTEDVSRLFFNIKPFPMDKSLKDPAGMD